MLDYQVAAQCRICCNEFFGYGIQYARTDITDQGKDLSAHLASAMAVTEPFLCPVEPGGNVGLDMGCREIDILECHGRVPHEM